MEQVEPSSNLDIPELLRAAMVVPERLDRPSTWCGHMPFAAWLFGLVRPRLLVELGVHYGGSYFNFCRTAETGALATRCYGVDTWKGDEHAGDYSEEVFDEVDQYNSRYFGGFSTLLRMTFAEAVETFADGSIDLLHVDGLHTYEGVKQDFESWLPKLSPTAVVLFHDTNVHDRGFGVWRFWQELKQAYPRHLEFLHSFGLGIVQLDGPAAPGSPDLLGWLCPEAPERDFILWLFAARGREVEFRYSCLQTQAALDEHVSLLGDRNAELHAVQQQLGGLQAMLAERDQEVDAAQQLLARLDEHESLLTQRNDELNAAQRLLVRGGRDLATLRQELEQASTAARQRDEMLASTSWRVTRPLRAVVGLLRRDPFYWRHLHDLLKALGQRLRLAVRLRAGAPAESGSAPTIPTAATAIPTAAARTKPAHAVYVSGESQTPGHYYRVECYAEAIRATGATCTIVRVEDIPGALAEIATADVLLIWRALWSDPVRQAIETARAAGARVVFDVDDLMFEPALARVSVIDGIRSQGLEEAAVADFYTRIRKTLQHADVCTVTTAELAAHARRSGIPAFVLPNGFDENTYMTARAAARHHATAGADDLLRMGYAGGSRTHQQDFRECSEAVATVLRNRRQARLVLFRAPDTGQPLVDLEEYPELLPHVDRVEWRDLVPIQELPRELARFDVNLAPLEPGNPFCEAKSELKFFEAALAGVCTVASPTGPFRRAIRHGETGFIAKTPQEWTEALTALLDDPQLRQRMARAAHDTVLWPFGAERRVERALSLLGYLGGGHQAARAFAVETRPSAPAAPAPVVPASRIVFSNDQGGAAAVTVIIPLYNYARFVIEALDSVAAQTMPDLDLIVIDDASTDESLQVACEWAARNTQRFNRLLVLSNLANSHLGPTRNVGFDAAETLYVFPLDADNRLLPDCLARCLETIRSSRAAFAYPVIQQFGASQMVVGDQPYDAARLTSGNYIDAMALVSKSAWALVGGYDDVRFGWEDYDFWCRLAERGLPGVAVGGKPVAEYRVHGSSMLRTSTDMTHNKASLVADIERRHPWVEIDVAPAPSSPSPAQATLPNQISAKERLEGLLPLLRCPETGQTLKRSSACDELLTADGKRTWPLVAGRPVFFPGLGEPRQFPEEHISNLLPEYVVERIRATQGLVLNLSAGGTAERLPNVVEVEAGVFRHTDLVADAHRLPFADAVFSGVVALNAFEHYADPGQVARELYRLLQPGGWLLIQTAFLQPEHEAPWHFYNCTREGLLLWFSQFAVEAVRVSENFSPMYALSWLAADCATALAEGASPEAAQRFADIPVRSLVQGWRDTAHRDHALWDAFAALPQAQQRGIAAGFELLAHKPHRPETDVSEGTPVTLKPAV